MVYELQAPDFLPGWKANSLIVTGEGDGHSSLLDTCLARYEDIPAVEKCERTVNAGLGGLFDFSCSAILDWRLWFSFFFPFLFVTSSSARDV